jgi:prolyl oligopeptidase
MYVKNSFNRVRPWVLAPALAPPIPLPGHPAYPSGHSTQMQLMARLLAYIVPDRERELMAIAENVAVNRERAGLHYPSDTDAGKQLAGSIFEILVNECAMFRRTLDEATQAEWSRPSLRTTAKTPEELIDQLKERTFDFLSHGSLYDAIRARAERLARPNLPVRFQFPGGEMIIRDGSLYDQDTLIVDGNAGAVVDFRLSPDSTKVAYGLKTKGGDVVRWSVKDLDTKELLGGTSVPVRLGTVYWDRASTGFYYSSPPSREEGQTGKRGKRIRYRSIRRDVAQDQRSDPVIFENPEWPNYADYGLWELETGQKLAYRVQGAAEIPLAAYLCEAMDDATPPLPRRLYASSEHTLGRFVTVHGNEAFFRTSTCEGRAANNFAIEAVELAESFRRRVLVPEDPNDVLIHAQHIGSFLILQYITPQLTNEVRFFRLDGQHVSTWRPSHSHLPDHGTLSSFSGDGRSTRAYFIYEGIATPPHTLMVDLQGGPTVTRLPSPEAPFDASRVTYKREDYQSVDGTRIPIQLMARSDVEHPAFIYLCYYGAIGTATLPTWNTTLQMILELGGMVAIANIRGGGEFGFKWQVPFKLDRDRTLEDIAEASRWLRSRYPVPVVSSGRSYGGMHTLASMAKSPKAFDLFVAEMPVSDVVEFLENGVFGRSAWDDFGFAHNAAGDLRKTPAEIEMLKRWSPRQKGVELVKPVLILTADTDERVEPAQAYGMAVALHQRAGNGQVFLRVESSDDGHAASTAVDVLTFIARHFGIEALSPLGPVED